MELTRERTATRPDLRSNFNIDNTDADIEMRELLREERDRATASVAESGQNVKQLVSADFVTPTWLKGLMPILWTQADGCRSKTVRPGQNCCLFYPLGYCEDMDVINGFCVFHLRAIFNLVYQTDCVYLMNAQNKPAMSQRTACYVSEPQIINDEYTALFPVMELFQQREIEIRDIKLHNLSKHLQMHGTQNWERIYTNHVNYLHKLFTLYSPRNLEQTVIQTRLDQLTNHQLMMHWNMWNEHHSNLLLDTPTDINVFYLGANLEQIHPLPMNQCTTITQMVARLFSEPYTSLDDHRFFSMVAPYGIYVQAHWSYANNLCAIGTHCTKSNLMCIGNLATLNMLRLDTGSCHRNTIHYAKRGSCSSDYCVSSRVNLDAPSMNKTVMFAGPNANTNVNPRTCNALNKESRKAIAGVFLSLNPS